MLLYIGTSCWWWNGVAPILLPKVVFYRVLILYTVFYALYIASVGLNVWSNIILEASSIADSATHQGLEIDNLPFKHPVRILNFDTIE